jgi:hypothetical protein
MLTALSPQLSRNYAAVAAEVEKVAKFKGTKGNDV